MEEKKKSLHYGWVIMIACCCYCAGSITLTMSIAGVFLPHLAEHSGLNIAEAAMWLTVMGPVSTVASPIWGHLMPKVKDIRWLTLPLALCQVAASIVFANAHSMVTVIIAGVLVGLSLSYVFGMLPATLMGNWFDERVRGRYMGIAFAFTGLGTFVFAPLMAKLIMSIGLSNAYYVAASIAFVLLVPITFFIRFTPEEKGVLPLGYIEGVSNNNTKDFSGLTLKQSLATFAFWALIVMYIGLSCLNGFNSMMPEFANEFLAGTMAAEDLAMFGATLVSIGAVGNIVSKLVFGFMTDKLGINATMFAFCGIIIVAFILWYLFDATYTLAVGAFLYAFSNAAVSIGLPMWTQEVFGLKDFPAIFAWTGIPAQFINGSTATVIGLIFLQTGSYKAAMFFGIGLVLLCVVAMALVMPGMKKLRARWDTSKPAEAEAETAAA